MEEEPATIVSPLVDPVFDMEIVDRGSLELAESGWIDRNTGLLFRLQEEIREGPECRRWRFRVGPADNPRASIRFGLERISARHSVSDTMAYRISRAAALEAFAGQAMVAANGGADAFFDLCLKAIRACHLRYARYESGSVHRRAFVPTEVRFQIVD